MTYKEKLDTIFGYGISVEDIIVANECVYGFDFDYTDKEFEKLCSFVQNIHLTICASRKKNDISVGDIVDTINNLIVYGGRPILDVLVMTKWDILTHIVHKGAFIIDGGTQE